MPVASARHLSSCILFRWPLINVLAMRTATTTRYKQFVCRYIENAFHTR